MPSFQHKIVKTATQTLIHNFQVRHSDIPFLRRTGDRFTVNLPLPTGTSVQEIKFEHFTAEWIRPTGAHKSHVILYCHGGGFAVGSAKTHRAMVAKIAADAKVQAFSLNYRLAPEHPFPAALEDALYAYDWLIHSKGYSPKQIILAGDSAGGGLSLSLLLALKAQHRELPLAAFLLCPWTDLAITGESVMENKTHDTVLQHFDIAAWAKMYYATYPPTHPLVSPLYADLSELPPLLIQISESEILRDDGLRLGYRAKEAGVKVEVQKWKGLIHTWQLFWQYVPEGKDAIAQIVLFLKQQIGT
ncbi:MAG: alpha/beta hydrolase [Bacteroidia bacterium]